MVAVEETAARLTQLARRPSSVAAKAPVFPLPVMVLLAPMARSETEPLPPMVAKRAEGAVVEAMERWSMTWPWPRNVAWN